ncbi:hypothetical protein [Lacticaseibacillus pantheris]|uniref:hypothetical protein n=1 Tax=Lacticaseibacillus pantheris TaxID=171523 RepID=UPI0006D00561|nr:hypothetical protein [Lacticaseibacillus pantheris]
MTDAKATLDGNQITLTDYSGDDLSSTDKALVTSYANSNGLQASYARVDAKAVKPGLPESTGGVTYTDLGVDADGNYVFEEQADDPTDLTELTNWFSVRSKVGQENGQVTSDLSQAQVGVFFSHVQYNGANSTLMKVYPDSKIVVLMMKGEAFTRFYLGSKMVVQANNNTFEKNDDGTLKIASNGEYIPVDSASLKPLTTIAADAVKAGGSAVYGYELTPEETTAIIRALAFAADNGLNNQVQGSDGAAPGNSAGLYASTNGFTDDLTSNQTTATYKTLDAPINSTGVDFAASAKVQIQRVDADGNPTDKDGNTVAADDPASIVFTTDVSVEGGKLNNTGLNELSATAADFQDDSQDDLAEKDINVSDALTTALKGDGTTTYKLVDTQATPVDDTNQKEGFYDVNDDGTAKIALDYKTAKSLTKTPTLTYTITKKH